MRNAPSFLLGALTAGIAAVALLGLGRWTEPRIVTADAAPAAESDFWFIG